MLEMQTLSVGNFQSNCYLIAASESRKGVLIDAGAQAEDILHWLNLVRITHILITHGHHDHTGALTSVRQALNIPVGVCPVDSETFGIEMDFALHDRDIIPIGENQLEVIHIPGHTHGSVAFRWVEAGETPRAVVGDAIFPGGPGHTRSPSDLALSLDSLACTVFTWPDESILYPGHGDPTTVGAERAAFEELHARKLPRDLCGDVTWR